MAICASPDDVSMQSLVYHHEWRADDRTVLRDVRERGRDIEGCIKQWFAFVKPNFHKFVEPQRNIAGMFVSIVSH